MLVVCEYNLRSRNVKNTQCLLYGEQVSCAYYTQCLLYGEQVSCAYYFTNMLNFVLHHQ